MGQFDALQLAENETGDPCFGLSVAAQMRPAAFHGLGLGFMVSDSLMEGFTRLQRFSRLLSTVLSFEAQETSTTIDLVLTENERLPTYVDSGLDAAMGLMLRLSQLTAGDRLCLRRVRMRRSAPACAGRMADFFTVTPEYDAPENRLCFERNETVRMLPMGNAELARVNDQAVTEYLRRFDQQDYLRQVRRRIIESLPDGAPRAAEIAGSLNVSLGSFLRRLHNENTHYKDLLNDVRRDLATEYVRDSQRPLTEITFLLGFSDQSNFTRAFRRWHGVPPQKLRAEAGK
jgi:AraC-like DNA-binding protein